MKVDIPRWLRHATLGLMVASLASTGCSTGGWKMPSSKMFSWGKKPSESTLAGSSSPAPTYPTSPATTQTPNALASAATKNAVPSMQGMPMGPTTSMPMGQSATATPPTSVPGYAPPNPGAAAMANGYATGPYNTFGQAGAAAALANNGVPARPMGTAPGMTPGMPMNPGMPMMAGAGTQPPVGFAATMPANTSSTPGLPSSQSYGAASPAAYGGRPGTVASAAMPSAGTPPLGTTGMAGMAMPARPAAPPGNFAGVAQTSAPNSPPQVGPPAGAPNFPASMPANGNFYAPVGASAVPSGLAQAAPSQSPAGISMPGATPGMTVPTYHGAPAPGGFTQVPAQTAGYTNPQAGIPATTAAYRPGSTSRPTGYNFGAPAATAGTPATAGAIAPTAVPNTANGMSNPGYSLPPSSTLTR
jgi:S-DNA-T family DNA segregation ATPase FtsK/SpoIIIE